MATYLVLDLETTGLDDRKDRILEIGFIVVDPFTLAEREFSPAVIQFPADAPPIDPVVVKMHILNGLWEASIMSNWTIAKAESYVLESIANIEGPIHLVGNSIWFDRNFIRTYMPTLDKRLHHRMVDVSTLNVLVDNTLKTEREKPNPPHRALEDARQSLTALRQHVTWMRAGGVGQ